MSYNGEYDFEDINMNDKDRKNRDAMEKKWLKVEQLLAKWDSIPGFADDLTDEWLDELRH
jgi:hypothetical protein